MRDRCTIGIVLLVGLIWGGTAGAAEPRWQLPTAGARHAADVVSWGTALSSVTLDTVAAWRSSDPRRALLHEGARVGLTYGLTFAAKFVVHRQRPCAPVCGSDNPNLSFFSGHTAVAFQAIGGARLSITIPLAVGTGALRMAAGKHWPTDVLVGAGVGWLTTHIVPEVR